MFHRLGFLDQLHLIVNDKGKILNFMFTFGNVDNRDSLKQKNFMRNKKVGFVRTKGYRFGPVRVSFP